MQGETQLQVVENYKYKDLRNGKRKIIYGFVIFLALMWLCTVISKSIYASKLPIVSTDRASEKYIEHIVEAEGIVVAGEKKPVTALSGLRIEKVLVQTGDMVEEGDMLFTIDMEDLKEVIKEKEAQISKIQVQIDTIKQNEALAKQRKELEEQRAREDYDALARYNNTLVGRASEEVNKIEKEIEEEGGGEEAQEKYREDLKSAAYAEADAKWARDNAIKEAGRKVEDIEQPENKDASLSEYQLELEGLEAELSKYKEIEEAEGKITAKEGGQVTDIYISEGSRIPDSAVLLLADDAVPCQFKALIDKEQKKYLGLNDSVDLELEGISKKMKLTVEYLAESPASPENYEIYINLPEGCGKPGLSGTINHSEIGDKYNLCISPLAIHRDSGGSRTYIYIVKEREGILGMEYYVEEVNVKILDENDSWAAVEGALDRNSEIINTSTAEVKKGDVVRF